jgi:hypothetical protein
MPSDTRPRRVPSLPAASCQQSAIQLEHHGTTLDHLYVAISKVTGIAVKSLLRTVIMDEFVLVAKRRVSLRAIHV